MLRGRGRYEKKTWHGTSPKCKLFDEGEHVAARGGTCSCAKKQENLEFGFTYSCAGVTY